MKRYCKEISGAESMAEVKGVREYNRIRRYMEHIYLYGFFSREDFERAGIGSGADYDYGTALLRAMYPELDSTAIWDDGKKHLRFARRYEHSGENRLANSYLFHSIDVECELLDYLCILLFAGKSPKSMEEICCGRQLISGELPAVDTLDEGGTNKYSTTRRRFLELVEQGYLTKERRKFLISENPLTKLSVAELIDLYSYADFASGVTYPQVAGSFLCRSIRRELRSRCIEQKHLKEICLFRRNSNRGVFDEEFVYELLEAIREKRAVQITIGKRALRFIPIALRVDVHYGRWYLLTYGKDHPQICRVSRMQSVKVLEKLQDEEWHAFQEQVLSLYRHTGCSGTYPPDGEPVLVEAKLQFGDNRGMYYQFLREMCMGQIAEKDEQMIYQAEVNDPFELLPFLRKYSPWLDVLPGQHDLDKRLNDDLRRIKMQLEAVED